MPAQSTPRFRPALRALSLALVLSAAAAVSAAQSPREVAGVRFDGHVQLAGQDLPLNGVGVRSVAWLKGYAAALYLGQPSSNAEQVVAQSGAKRLQIRMLLDVPVAEFIKAFHKGVERNTPLAQQASLSERMARFDALVQPLGQVRKGDTVTLDFMPGQGLLFSHNSRVLGAAIPGEDLYGALLRCFIGEHPVDDKLKAGLLGSAT